MKTFCRMFANSSLSVESLSQLTLEKERKKKKENKQKKRDFLQDDDVDYFQWQSNNYRLSYVLGVNQLTLKFPFGPIMSPKPGPTFDIEVAAPEIADKKSSPEIDKSIDIIKNNNK